MIALWAFLAGRALWQRLPRPWGYALAQLLADLVFLLWRDKRRHTIENMRQVMGALGRADLAPEMARRSWRNYFTYLVDFVRLPRLRSEELQASVRFEDWQCLEDALGEGRGVLGIGLHFGNWDLGAALLAQRGYPLNLVVETMRPRALNQVVQKTRGEKGVKIIPPEQAARILSALRRNEIVALLIDRPDPQRGVPVTFCGAPLRVPAGPARVALKTGAAVLTGGLVRLSDTAFRGVLRPCPPGTRSGDLWRDVQDLTQRIMTSLEELVLAYPDQWYMFRRMWSEVKAAQSAPGAPEELVIRQAR